MARKTLTKKQMLELGDKELFEVSMRKNKIGCATKEALAAQALLRERHLKDWVLEWDNQGGNYLSWYD